MKHWFVRTAKRPTAKLLGFSTLTALYLECFIRGDLGKLGAWLTTHPHMVLMNILTVYCITLVVHSLFNRRAVTFTVVTVLAFLFGLVNSLKYKTLGQYYYPWDNSLVGELGGVSKNVVNLDFTLPVVFLVIGVAIVALLLRSGAFSGTRLTMKAWHRVLALCVAAACLGGMVFHKEWKLTKTLELLGVRNYAWAPVNSYQNNGSVVAYLVNWRMNYVEKPKNYSKEQIAAIVDDITAAYEQDHAARGGSDGVKPNVIVVMSEALWDPNQLSSLTFSENPMKNLNAARKASFVSPTFGGYTCNVEFEFLTGMTMKYLPPSSVPYQHFIKKPVPALPSELKRNGYATVAIHPYHPWFWGRDKVYPLLGFDAFITEEAFAGAPTKGYYTSDDAVMDKVIEQIEAKQEPLFAFAVTMQNHGPYKDNRYKGTELQITGPAVPEQMLDTYAQGVYDADRAFKKLTDYVAASDEPTLVIQFGDHLPSLGESFEMYRKYGYLRPEADSYQNMTGEEQLKIRCTQVSTFSNYKDISLPAYVSPSMLSVRILDYTGAEMSDYYKMLYGLTDTFSCIYGQNIINNDGVVAQMDSKASEAFWQLEYDLLVGHQYFNEIEDERLAARQKHIVLQPQ